MLRIKINGVWFYEENGIRERVVRAYNTLLFNLEKWRPSINALDFKVLEMEETERLDEPFSKEKVFSAL